MGRERRRAERLPAKLFVVLQPRKGSGAAGRGVVLDVSPLGLAVETEAELNQGDVYFCHVEIPFALKARVVRTYSGGVVKRYGMEIMGQGLLDKFILRRMLKGIKQTRKV